MKFVLILVISGIGFSALAQKLNSVKPYYSIGAGIQFGSVMALSPAFQIESGVALNRRIDLGLQVGLEKIPVLWSMPIFLRSKFKLLNKNNSPFIDANFGYLLPLKGRQNNKGGISFGNSVGYQISLTERVGIETSIGYRLSFATRSDDWMISCARFSQINRVELRFAFTFK